MDGSCCRARLLSAHVHPGICTQAWEGVKEAIPGTKEHAAIHPGSGTSGLGAVGAGTGRALSMQGVPAGICQRCP